MNVHQTKEGLSGLLAGKRDRGGGRGGGSVNPEENRNLLLIREIHDRKRRGFCIEKEMTGDDTSIGDNDSRIVGDYRFNSF